HRASQPNTFSNAAVFGIIKTCIGYLQTTDRCLKWRQLVPKIGLANRLCMAQAADRNIEKIICLDRRIDAADITKRLINKLLVVPVPLRLCCRHVIGNIYDCVTNRSQIGKFNKAGDTDFRIRDVEPEMLRHGAPQLEQKTYDANVADGS